MDSNEDIHELARRARVERSLYIAEALAELIIGIQQFLKRELAGPDAGRPAKPVRRTPVRQLTVPDAGRSPKPVRRAPALQR